MVVTAKAVPPMCMIEVQRWKQGHYSLLHNNNVQHNLPSVTATIFFDVDQSLLGDSNCGKDMSGIIVHSIKKPLVSMKYKNHHRLIVEELLLDKRKLVADYAL